MHEGLKVKRISALKREGYIAKCLNREYRPTKYIYAKMIIYWREKSINKMYKPPCNVESNSHR